MAEGEAARTGKPQEIELWTNRVLIHPMSRRLATLLAPTPITPNIVSCMGALASAMAAACYLGLPWPWGVAAGFGLQIAWHVLDGADGALARLTGRSSPTGEVVDGVCDYLAQLILYSALAYILSASLGGWAWLLALGSGVSRAVQANSYESRRRTYQFWGYGGVWLKQSLGGQAREAPRGWLGALGHAYLAVSDRVAPSNPALETAMNRRLSLGLAEAAEARSVYRALQARAISAAAPLSANLRSIAIAVSMLAGSPLYFFLFEILGLTAVLMWSLRVQARSDAAVVKALAVDVRP